MKKIEASKKTIIVRLMRQIYIQVDEIKHLRNKIKELEYENNRNNKNFKKR